MRELKAEPKCSHRDGHQWSEPRDMLPREDAGDMLHVNRECDHCRMVRQRQLPHAPGKTERTHYWLPNDGPMIGRLWGELSEAAWDDTTTA